MNYKCQKIALFPTLVFSVEDFLSKEQCKNIARYIKNKELGQHSAIIGDGATTYHSKETELLQEISNNVTGCENVYSTLNEVISQYSSDSGIEVLKGIDNSWTNIQNVGSVLAEHTHPLSTLSGAIYIHADANSSSINFINPNPFVNFTNYYETRTEFSFYYYYLKPSIGQLIIFPSWLKHGSNGAKNNTKGRTVISFNVF